MGNINTDFYNFSRKCSRILFLYKIVYVIMKEDKHMNICILTYMYELINVLKISNKYLYILSKIVYSFNFHNANFKSYKYKNFF